MQTIPLPLFELYVQERMREQQRTAAALRKRRRLTQALRRHSHPHR